MSIATIQDGPIDPLVTFDQTVRDNLGLSTRITTSKEGYAHSTTGIPYAIHGKATIVEQKVGLHLASFNDPIKALLGTGVHRDEKIIIRRKYVIGQSATITPERAPARTVAIKEDTREVHLVRYGADIEMNLNLFLRPADAQEELDMKVDAQKGELERELVKRGYECVLREGTELVSAILKSNPGYSATDPNGADASRAMQIQQSRIFGALNKFERPVASLLAACRYATAYACGSQRGSLLIVPHGAPDILRYARPSQMQYSVTGVKQTDGKKITMDLENVYEDPASGVKIAIQYPMPNYGSGAAHAYTTMEDSPLTRKVKIVECFTNASGGNAYVANLKTGEPGVTVPDGQHTYRVTEVIASSAILGAPGSNTGELLYAYPSTGCSTSHTQEQMMIQLRVYLGAALYQPENVLILRDVLIENVVSCVIAPPSGAWVGAQPTSNTNNWRAEIGTGFAESFDRTYFGHPGNYQGPFDADLAAAAGGIDNATKERITTKFKLMAPSFDFDEDVAPVNAATPTRAEIMLGLQKAMGRLTACNGYDKDTGKALPQNSEFSAFGVMDHPQRYTSLSGSPHMFSMSKATFD